MLSNEELCRQLEDRLLMVKQDIDDARGTVLDLSPYYAVMHVTLGQLDKLREEQRREHHHHHHPIIEVRQGPYFSLASAVVRRQSDQAQKLMQPADPVAGVAGNPEPIVPTSKKPTYGSRK